ncbi:hypothetical protein B296_00026807, partial [Ensete ventricosum]
ESKRERDEERGACTESDGSSQGRRPCEATGGGERCTRLRVVEAAAAAAPPPQGLVVGVVVAVRGRMVGRRDAVGPGRKSRDLDRRTRAENSKKAEDKDTSGEDSSDLSAQKAGRRPRSANMRLVARKRAWLSLLIVMGP